MNAHVLHLFESAARHPDWIDPIGWILVHSLWQFALVAIVLGAALRLMSRHSSTARYGTALAALAAMVLLPMATWFVLPHTETIKRLPSVALAASAVAANSATATLAAPGSVAADRSQPMTSSMTASRLRRGRRPAIRPIVEPPTKGDVTFPPLQEAALESPADDGFEPAAASAVAPAVTHAGWRQRLEAWLPTIVWGWLVGVLLFALRPAWSAWTVWQLRRTGTVATSAELADLFQRTTAKLGLRREVRLLQSAVMQVPAVIGYLRPVVLVPISVASGFPPEQLEALFAHELAHVRRHDYLVNLLQTVIETVFFYHPAIWWVSSQIRCERENCCDDVALRVVSRQTDYAKALVALEALRSRPPLMTVAASHGSLLARIRRIVGINQEPKPGFAALLCAALVLAALAVGNMAAQTSEVPAATKTPAPAAAKDLLTTAELNQSPYHVTLPDGSVIALLGLGTSPADGDHWWKPDGTPLAQAPPKPVAADAWGQARGNQTVRGIALDAITQKGGNFQASVSGTTWYATPTVQTMKDGSHETHRFVLSVSAKSSTTIFVKYFAKQWRTVGASSNPSYALNQIEFPEGSAVFASPAEKDGTARSVVMYDVKDRDVRVVAVDWQNGEHPPGITMGDGRSRMVESQFQGLPLRQIKEFRFQIRDSRKIEFRNVSLQPNEKTNVEIYVDGKPFVPQAADPAKAAGSQAAASSATAVHDVAARDRAFRVPLPEGGEIRFEGICDYPTRGHAWRRPDGSPLKQAPANLPADTGNGWFPHSILREFAFETVTPAGQGAVHVYGLREHSFSEFVSLKEGDGDELRQHRIVAEFPEKSTVGTLDLGFFRGTWSPFRPVEGKDHVTLSARVEFEPAPSEKLAAERTWARAKATFKKRNGRWDSHLDQVPLSSVQSSDVRIVGTLSPSDFQFRLVAVDRENHEHPTMLYATESGVPTIHCAPSLPLSFRSQPFRAVCWDVPRDKVKEFRFLTQPLHFHHVEFRNLALRADQKTSVEVYVDGKRAAPGEAEAATKPTAVQPLTVSQPTSASAKDEGFHIPLPDGGELEFAGISEHSAQRHGWWRLDGSLRKQPPEGLPPQQESSPSAGSVLREFAFNTLTPGGPAGLHALPLFDKSAVDSVSTIDLPGKILRRHFLLKTIPDSAPTASFDFEYLGGPWTPFQPSGKEDVTLHVRVDINRQPSEKEAVQRLRVRGETASSPGDSHGVANGQSSAAATEAAAVESMDVRISGTVPRFDAELRVVAIDRDNREHSTVMYHVVDEFKSMIVSGPTSPLDVGPGPYHAVCWDLPRDQIKEFRILTRPLNFHRIEFRNLPLHPGQHTDPEVSIDGKRFRLSGGVAHQRADAAGRIEFFEPVTAVVAPATMNAAPAPSTLTQATPIKRQPAEKPSEISVLVTDAAGHAVAGAIVGRCVDFQCYQRAKTDAAGRAVLPVWSDPGFQYLFAVKPGVGVDYIAAHDPGQSRRDPHAPAAAAAEPYKLVLRGTRSVRLRLKNEESQPIALARVSPIAFQLPDKGNLFPVAGIQEFEAQTDKQGVATFANLPANQQGKIRFALSNSLLAIPAAAAFDPAAPVEQIEAVARRDDPMVEGSVFDPDGKPAPQAEVAIVAHQTDDDPTRSSWRSFLGSRESNAAGRFVAAIEQERLYEFCASRGPFVSAWQTYVWPVGTPIPPVKLQLQQGVRVHGRWLRRDDQGPAAGATLTLYEGSTGDDSRLPFKTLFPNPVRKSLAELPWPNRARQFKTDEKGKFEFFVRPGNYYLEAGLARTLDRENAAFTITDRPDFEINFQSSLPQFRGFVGNVVLKSNLKQVVPLAVVEGVSTDADHTGDDFRAECGDDGEFHIQRAAREMLLYATSPSRALSSITRIAADANDLTLPIAPTASVHGRLVDRGGKPLANRVIESGVPVKFENMTNLEFGSHTTTDQHGEFVLSNLTPGWRWELAVSVLRSVGDRGLTVWQTVGGVQPAAATRVELGDLTLSTTEPAPPPTEIAVVRPPMFQAASEADIAAVQATANREHKRVLLLFGTDGSAHSRCLADVLARNPELSATIHKLFVPLFVDASPVSKVFAKYVPRYRWQSGLPVLTVLDSDGKSLVSQWMYTWDFGRSLLNSDASKLQAFLLQWTPAP